MSRFTPKYHKSNEVHRRFFRTYMPNLRHAYTAQDNTFAKTIQIRQYELHNTDYTIQITPYKSHYTHATFSVSGSKTGSGALDRVSATTRSLPSLCLITKSYFCNLSSILWKRGGASCKDFFKMHLKWFMIIFNKD